MTMYSKRGGAWRLVGSILLGLAVSGCSQEGPSVDPPGSSGGTSLSTNHEHETAEETCFICDAAKREPGRLWCTEHARYEDRCWDCQPQLEEPGRLYCEEHGLYEDECHLCRPAIGGGSEDKQGARLEKPSKAPPDLFCKEHQVPEAECGICQPQLSAELMPGDELKVRFESPEAAAKAGIETVAALQATSQASTPAFCEVAYNENALARITPLAPGIVRKVLVDVGEDVVAGDVLVELHSAEVAGAKAELISAIVNLELNEVAHDRERLLAEKNISSDKEVQEAEAACKLAELTLGTARQRLLNFGLTGAEVARVEEDRDTAALLLVRAPFDGTLIARNAVVGELVQPGESVFSLADLSAMWVTLSIPADRAGMVRKGLEVEATFSGFPGRVIRGEITWVDTSIDERSRMLQARAVVDNADRRLSAGMFGDAKVLVADARSVVDIPVGAVQRFEDEPYVFVKLEDDLYSLRRVAMLDRPQTGTVAVVRGLRANEPVVATGAFTVMSEFLKSRLGAGCVDD